MKEKREKREAGEIAFLRRAFSISAQECAPSAGDDKKKTSSLSIV